MEYFPHRFAAPMLAACVWLLGSSTLAAQTRPAAAPSPSEREAALDAELFYELLLGEINTREGDPGAGYALILDAARRTGEEQLYRRATEIALQSHSGPSALVAVRAWQGAHPLSRDANRFLLRILVSLNQVAETEQPLRQELALAPPRERAILLHALPLLYAQVSDKALAAKVVQHALRDTLADPALAPVAWTNVGRMRLAAQDKPGALQALRQAQAADPANDAAATLALQLLEDGVGEAQPLLAAYLADKPLPEIRLSYARWLIDAQRLSEAQTQIDTVTRERPDIAQAWLLKAALQLQDGLLDEAQASLEHFTQLLQALPAEQRPQRPLAQVALMQAQIAEKRGDFPLAERWLSSIDDADRLLSVHIRQASLLARQNRLDEALALIESAPTNNADQERAKRQVQAQLLAQAGRFAQAYDVLAQAAAAAPKDDALAYDLAMMAQKAGRRADEERLLREILQRNPNHHHALNALGYTLADRGEQLPEARALITRALAQAPQDPYIIDSLGWVEFRLGNPERALTLLSDAFRIKPDAEIAAHLGEVLWTLGLQQRALDVWRQGLGLDADNATLRATLKRLGAQP